MQTHKIKPFPVVLFNSKYWDGLLDWLENTVLLKGFISEKDFNLLRVSDKPEEVAQTVQNWYLKQEIVGRKALVRLS